MLLLKFTDGDEVVVLVRVISPTLVIASVDMLAALMFWLESITEMPLSSKLAPDIAPVKVPEVPDNAPVSVPPAKGK